MRSCPKCKSSEYNNRSFTLMINECGHSLCRNCVELIFARGSAECPTCKRTLKRNGFWEQTFDDSQVEKEIYFRKKLGKTFNLKEEDFPDLRAYNDYLEMFESLVFNFANGTNVEETSKRVEEFRKENEELIAKNRGRKSKDELWVQQMLEEDARFRTRVSNCDQDVYKGSSDAKAIIEELQKSDQPAAFIVINKQKEQTAGTRTYQNGAGGVEKARMLEEAKVFVPISYSSGERFVYHPPPVAVNGPEIPCVSELEAIGYLNNIRRASPDQMGGGYHEVYSCLRALTEARLDLFAF